MTIETYKVQKLDVPVDWVVEVPGSKSIDRKSVV